jgi:hypothetical protein
MRFKAGFVVGCAAGVWAASKASHLRHPTRDQGSWPRVVNSRADLVGAGGSDLAVERLRALFDLARERVGDVFEGQFHSIARDRASSVLNGALAGDSEADDWSGRRQPA